MQKWQQNKTFTPKNKFKKGCYKGREYKGDKSSCHAYAYKSFPFHYKTEVHLPTARKSSEPGRMACTVWPGNLPGQVVKGLRNQKQNVHWHWIQMRENGGSLNFIFISLPSPLGDENWVRWHIVCCAAHVWKMMPGTMFQSIKTFCEQQIHWTFPLSHTVALSLVIDALSIRFYLLTGTSPMLLLFGSAFSMSLISGVSFKTLVHSWTYFLLFSPAHFQIASTATTKLLHHFGFLCKF